ncbi:MAG: hypothetical protein Q9192_003214 [Flavoplaca navasiana]
MTPLESFAIHEADIIYQGVLARFPDEQIDVGDDDWSQGAKVKVVKRLTEYWIDGFDWRAEEARINAEFDQFKVKIDIPDYGPQVLHYAHQASPRPDAIPLLFVQGWPGSFLEARKIIQPLTNPPDAATQAFHVVVPSIPGFGPGDAPEKSGFGVQLTAHGFTKLMVEVLGYKRFVTQGGDWGSMITRSMALLYPQNVRACHHNFFPCRPPPWYKAPFTMGRLIFSPYLYTKRDSPIGLLGWLVEKFHEWMDVAHYQMSDNEVLTFVMMHWMQGATPGLRYYKMAFAEERPAYVEDATAESGYDYDAQSGSEDGLIQESVEEVIPAATDKPSNDLQDEDYSTYNELLREARDYYREDKPPFTSITTGKIQASRSAVLATANGERPTTITPDLLLTLTRREWSSQCWFWTADYKGERFIVKAVNGQNSLGGNNYRRCHVKGPGLKATAQTLGNQGFPHKTHRHEGQLEGA